MPRPDVEPRVSDEILNFLDALGKGGRCTFLTTHLKDAWSTGQRR